MPPCLCGSISAGHDRAYSISVSKSASLTSFLEEERATRLSPLIRVRPKKVVFAQWQKACLGRIQNAQIAEQRKSWMIYDIVRAKYNESIANQVA